MKFKPIDHRFPGRGPIHESVTGHECNEPPYDDQPMILDQPTHVDNKSGDCRERPVAEHVVKDGLEFRHDEHEQKSHNGDGHRDYDGGINHRSDDLVLNFRGFLLKFSKTVEHELEHAAELPGFHHVDVKIVEDQRMQGKRIGKRTAALDSVGQFVDGVFKHLIALLFFQDV